MGLILDTCVFIQAEKNQQPLDFNRWEKYGAVYICAITAAELLIGVHRANTESRRITRSAFVEAIINKIPILDFSIETARSHAELYAALAEQGNLIGAHDLIIAATAVTHGYSLLTANIREFNRVPGLNVLKLNA